MVVLDFNALPVISSWRTLHVIDGEVIARLRWLTRTTERAQNAVRFSLEATRSAEMLHCSEQEVARIRNGYFRAALAELVSIEDILNADLADAGKPRHGLKLSDTGLPHLHLFRELRNHEIHLHHSRLSASKKAAMWVTSDGQRHDFEHTIWRLDGVSIETFSQLRNAQRFERADIRRMIQWFNTTQADWGVQEMFLLSVEEYCKQVLAKHP